MSLFQKKLEDIIRGSRASGVDLATYNSQIMQETKTELKSQDPDVKAQALLKLFYFLSEGHSIDWASFNILECMSSSSAEAKKIGLIFGSLLLSSNPDAVMMATNLFKKEIKSNNLKEVSMILSCLGNVRNKNLGQDVLPLVINCLTHSKPLIRKKAVANLRTIFTTNPHLIQENLEKVLQRIPEEHDPSVLNSIISLCFTVIDLQPALHPLLIKPLFNLFEMKKNNWVFIKLVKLFDRLIYLEPRLKKKLADVYLKFFATTNAKSLEYELIITTLTHFVEFGDLYKKACHCLKSFIDSTDPNLKGMGLESLKQILQNDPAMMEEYYDFLVECYKKGDNLNKITISSIFADHLDNRSVEETVNLMIKDLERIAAKEGAFDASDLIIQNILKLCSKNYYSNVGDAEWFLMDVLLKIMPKLKNPATAKIALDILIDFTLRVEEIKDSAIDFGTELLQALDKGDFSFRSLGQSPFLFEYETEEKHNISVAVKVIEALLFIFGEYSSHIKTVEGFLSIVKTLERVDAKVLVDVLGPLEISVSKLIITFSEFIKANKSSEEVLQTAVKELNLNSNSEAQILPIIQAYIKRCVKLFLKVQTAGNGALFFLKNYYLSTLLQAIDPSDFLLKDIDNFTLSEDSLQIIQSFKERYFQKIKPIQKNAQSLVKIPEAVANLEIKISPEEEQMLSTFEKDINTIVKTVAKAEEQKSNAKIETRKTTSEPTIQSPEMKESQVEEKPVETKPVRQKKEFKVNVEEDAPTQPN